MLSLIEISGIAGYDSAFAASCKLYFTSMKKQNKVKGKKDF